jgi:type I restriction enzyme R subunit
MNESQPPLDERFKDSDDPLRLVFLCAMWLTGFDAPSCSTVYLDKPMRNHTLMQTIARANRVFPGKHSGMIVDYANVFLSLEKALAVRNKQELVDELRAGVNAASAFCESRAVVLQEIELLAAGSFERLEQIEDAVKALISPDSLRREFLGHERLVCTLFRAVKPDSAALQFAGRVACLVDVAAADAIPKSTNSTLARIRDASILSGAMVTLRRFHCASATGCISLHAVTRTE